jgi:hypothetical protein
MAAAKRTAAKKRPTARRPAGKGAPKAARKRAGKVPARSAKKAVGKRTTGAQASSARVGKRTAKTPRAGAKKAPRKSTHAPKTAATSQNVGQFIAGIADATMRADAEEIARMLGEITGVEAKMWGPSIVGFGQYHYRYDSGHEGDMCLAGFSPRKDALTLYVMPGFERYGDLLSRLGKHKTGKSCLYVKRLDDVDRGVLRAILERSVEIMAPKRTA